jgi:pimeloyl-ACP methyl ester carboxylesterase
MDELGWDTAHIVGNSLGGWVAFELERRGRARSVTGIAAAGGWTRWSPIKFEVIAKFISGMPILLLSRLLGQRVLRLPFSRRLATLPLSGSPYGISERELSGIVEDAAHCPAYFQLLLKALLLPGLLELAQTAVPAHVVLCEKDRVVPPRRFSRHFTDYLPANTKVTKIEGVGHVPMFEAPGRVTEVITDFIDQCSSPAEVIDPPAS